MTNDLFTCDDLQYKGLKLWQSKFGYRSSQDALFLLNFALEKISVRRHIKDVIELGIGSGIISMLLAAKIPYIKITAIEIQDSLLELSKKNISQLPDTIKQRILLRHIDIRNIPNKMIPQKYDLLITNPPYYKIGTGRLSPSMEKRIAKYEIKCNLIDIISASQFLLKKHCIALIIYPKERLSEFRQELRRFTFEKATYHLYHNKNGRIDTIKSDEEYKGEFHLFIAELEK